MKKVLSVLLLALVAQLPLVAVPYLQLDIAGGSYDEGTESTEAGSNTFTLYALVNSTSPTGTFYVSAAVSPKLPNDPVDLGSFTFAGEEIAVSADMTWGRPAQMPPHDVYDTWYKEFSFTFDSTLRTTNYNVEDAPEPHEGPVPNAAGNALYMPFSIDVSGLVSGTTIVFDLYTYEQKSRNKVKISFAPFSHNAEATTITVPDGGTTMFCAGAGLMLLGGLRRYWRR